MNPASLRADAAGNRARIIQAARALIANADEVKLNAIARQAGVGQGTLYRHFPTREDLLAKIKVALGGRVAEETGPKRTRGGERPDDAGTGGRYHEAAPSTSRMIRLVPLGSTYDPGSSAAMC